MRVQIYEFVCNRPIIRFRTYDLVSPCVRSHPLRFLAYLLNLYVDTWSCLHVCPSLAYYGESYFAQHTSAAKRQKKAIKTGGYKVSNNLAPPPKRVLRSTLPGRDVAGGSPRQKAAVLSQEDEVEDGLTDEEPSDDEESGGGNPDSRADEVEYDDDVDAEGGGSGLHHGMAKLKAAMTVPGSTAARFAERVVSTTATEMATAYKAVVRGIVDDQAGALAAALAPEAKD
jgi:hypothetical protein